MFVISRNTAFTYRNKPVDTKQIGRELGVRYVLEGSVQRSDKQVRVNARSSLMPRPPRICGRRVPTATWAIFSRARRSLSECSFACRGDRGDGQGRPPLSAPGGMHLERRSSRSYPLSTFEPWPLARLSHSRIPPMGHVLSARSVSRRRPTKTP